MYSQNSHLFDSDSYENHNVQVASSPKTNADIKNITSQVNELITRCQNFTDQKIVLIVDDSIISSRMIANKISTLGFESEVANNGKVAFDLLNKHPDKYYIVLLDICMPICCGMELLKLMKSSDSLKNIPVIIVSSLEEVNINSTFKSLGAIEVLSKPFQEALFLSVLDRLLLN